MLLESEGLIIGVIAQEMAGVCRRVVEMGSRGHIVGQLRVKSLDNSLSVSWVNVGKGGKKGESVQLEDCMLDSWASSATGS